MSKLKKIVLSLSDKEIFQLYTNARIALLMAKHTSVKVLPEMISLNEKFSFAAELRLPVEAIRVVDAKLSALETIEMGCNMMLVDAGISGIAETLKNDAR